MTVKLSPLIIGGAHCTPAVRVQLVGASGQAVQHRTGVGLVVGRDECAHLRRMHDAVACLDVQDASGVP